MPDAYLTARELAPRLRVTPATILSWHRRGLIPSVSVTRRPVLFDLAEVQKALRKRSERREGSR